VDAIRRSLPGAAILYTHFSPSARRYAADLESVDAAEYLPLDLAGRTRRFIDLTKPDLLLLVGAEMWPNLIWTAADRRVPVAQACCRLVGSERLGWLARGLTRELYRHLDAIAAVAPEDGELLRGLGVPEDRIRVTGDTRVDVTLERAAAAQAEGPVRVVPRDRGPVIVAGSTWAPDEAVLLPALAELAAARPGLLAFVAPHQPSEHAVQRLEEESRRLGLAAVRWDSPDRSRAPLAIVDAVGVLYRLYGLADVAFVGGGFGGAVHNTMEPAAMGVPVAVGPRHGDPYEVDRLAAAGGLRVVRSAPELAAWWSTLLDGGRAHLAGGSARRALEQMAGATGRILGLLSSRGHPVLGVSSQQGVDEAGATRA
jgi:3-deoxy-D-manno-octulosonic-acid transferase